MPQGLAPRPKAQDLHITKRIYLLSFLQSLVPEYARQDLGPECANGRQCPFKKIYRAKFLLDATHHLHFLKI